MANRKILYVDDKSSNLNAFKALLRRDFDVYTSTDPVQAVELAGQESVAVVIADFKMPIMTGVKFLEAIRTNYPDTVRILLSGHADINAVIESVNKGEVFRFISKPWVEELLINEIKNAFELYDAKQSLKQQNAELERAYKELSQFTYNAAHNLNGPAATMQGLINLCRTEPENVELYLGYLETTLSSLTNNLQNIISYNENRMVEPIREEVKLKPLINEMLSEFKYQPGFNKVLIDVRVQPDHTFISDTNRIKLVLSNLLVNAIKYADDRKAGAKVRVESKIIEDQIKILVEDNGIGISKSNLSRVKEIFFRESTGQMGSGMGLYVVQETVDLLKGTFTIESEKGQYTRAILSFPLNEGK